MGAVRVRLLFVTTVLLGLVAPAPARASSVAVVTIEGRGWGHGVGLSQYGALWMAEDGAAVPQILQHFYPGTNMGTGRGPVRVVVHSVPTATVLGFPNGGEVRGTGEGFPVAVPAGGQVRVAFEGGVYRVERIVTGQSSEDPAAWGQVPTIPTIAPTTSTTRSGTTTTRPLLPPVGPTTTTTRPPSTTTTRAGASTTAAPGQPPTTVAAQPSGVASSTPVVGVPAMGGVVAVPERARQYRGVVHATAAAGPLRLINELDVEDYLRGMGEMPASWPQAAQGAQAVVARTYALRAMAVNGEICDYVRCQVYLGQTAERPGRDQAVTATRGQVLGYNGQLATAVYASNHGGISATTLEGFGTPDGRYPYLRPVRYVSRDPFPWKVDVALRDVAARVGYRGTITGIAIRERGPSGRPLQVAVTGDAGELVVTGVQLTRKLGLRSTLWELRLGEADVAPPPPPEPEGEGEGDIAQALPDDESALSAASLETADSIELEARREQRGAPAVPDEDGSSTDRTAQVAVAAAALGLATLGSLRGFGVIRPGFTQRALQRVRRRA